MRKLPLAADTYVDRSRHVQRKRVRLCTLMAVFSEVVIATVVDLRGNPVQPLTAELHECSLPVVGTPGGRRVLRRYFIAFFIGFVLTGCADSETRSIVSSSDLSGNKYRRIAVFVEGSDPAKSRPSAGVSAGNGAISLSLFIPAPSGSASMAEVEQKIVSALGDLGIQASSGPALFSGQTLSNQAKVTTLQKGFDAVLYVAVLTNGMTEQRVAGASHDGKYITFGGGGPELIDDYTLSSFELKSDGTVWSNVPTFKANCDLQDTKTSKPVWSSETIATGGTAVLLSRVSDQIVAKMRGDGAI